MIFSASTDPFSAQHTRPFLESIVSALLGHPLAPTTFEPLHFAIRKLAHLTEYAVLGALAFRAVRGDERGWSGRWASIAVGIALAVAASDEFHQSFLSSRTGSPIDVLIDTAGATISQIALRTRHSRSQAGILKPS